ncbi:ACP synthase [Paraburkholderia dilworthii]|uniref:ACP synthase n=1 Tax=Paraburkholderia dilworthii TaxID=948106 RepID=A0ABW9DAS3_9BURK
MTRRSATSFQYKHPSTHAEIVEAAKRTHAKRIAELNAASKMIIAIEPDLAALTAQGIYYSISDHSMYLVDWSTSTSGTTKKALRINCSLWGEYGDRMVSAFLARGWIVEEAKADGRMSKVLLRRPKTRVRISLECSEEFAKQLSHEPASEAQ